MHACGSSVVRAFAHGAMGHVIDSSWWTMTGLTKAVICYPVCGMVDKKELLLHVVAVVGFLSPYLSGPLPYVRRHITVNKMC